MVLRSTLVLVVLIPCVAYSGEQARKELVRQHAAKQEVLEGIEYRRFMSEQARKEKLAKREAEQEVVEAARGIEGKRLMKEITGRAIGELIEKAEQELQALGNDPAKQQERTHQEATIARMRGILQKIQEGD